MSTIPTVVAFTLLAGVIFIMVDIRLWKRTRDEVMKGCDNEE